MALSLGSRSHVVLGMDALMCQMAHISVSKSKAKIRKIVPFCPVLGVDMVSCSHSPVQIHLFRVVAFL